MDESKRKEIEVKAFNDTFRALSETMHRFIPPAGSIEPDSAEEYYLACCMKAMCTNLLRAWLQASIPFGATAYSLQFQFLQAVEAELAHAKQLQDAIEHGLCTREELQESMESILSGETNPMNDDGTPNEALQKLIQRRMN